MQLIELGAPLEILVVPSIGSIAISNCGAPGTQVPSCSPLKIPGASSLMPSPITTSPQMFIRSNIPRIASQAAASAASLSPRPNQRSDCLVHFVERNLLLGCAGSAEPDP